MKRYFALLLMFCMMLCLALSTASAEGQILQDEQPPKLVAKTNEAGESIVAEICDVQKSVIEQIKYDGTLALTDVHFRATVEDEMVSQRLTAAYLGVMNDVHYSDVKCLLHEDHPNVKADIDDAVRSLEVDAYDLVMYELFDVSLAGEEKDALLADGGVLSMTLEVMPHQSVPLVVLFTPDGIKWQVLPFETVDDKRFAIELSCEGTVALLADGREYAGIGDAAQGDSDTIGNYAMETVTNPFTPSVAGKFSPMLMGFMGLGGETVIGRISNGVGGTTIEIPDNNVVLTYSVAERKFALDIQTFEHLEWAYNSILEVGSVGNLYTENVDAENEEGLTLAAGLNEILKQMGLELTHEQLAVKDLFEVTAYGDYLPPLYDETSYMELTFDANLDPNKPLVVIYSADSEHWGILDQSNVTFNADGTVTLKLYDLGVVAFLVEAEFDVNEAEAVQAP